VSVRGLISGRAVGGAGLVVAVALLCITFARSTPAYAAGEYELNDTRETAFGPLAGGTDYTATFETNNDNDWYVFYIKTYSQMDLSGSMLVGANCFGSIREVELFDGDGHEIKSFRIGASNVTERLNITLNAGRYYVKFRNIWNECVGDRYRFRIDPAAAITPSRECGEAIVARDSVAPLLAQVNAKVAKNGEALAKVEALVQQRKATLAKLRRQRRVPRWRKRRARAKLEASKAAQEKVEVKRIGLQTLGAQYTTAINQANAQIAVSC
jgi:hypothetical protein